MAQMMTHESQRYRFHKDDPDFKGQYVHVTIQIYNSGIESGRNIYFAHVIRSPEGFLAWLSLLLQQSSRINSTELKKKRISLNLQSV